MNRAHETALEILTPTVQASPGTAPKQVVVCGLRGSATFSTAEHSLVNVCASPLELFSSVELTGCGRWTSVRVYPNHCEQHYTSAGQETRLHIFSAVSAPWIGILIERTNPRAESITINVTPHLDYISKFCGAPAHSFVTENHRVLVRCAEHPELEAAVLSDATIGTRMASGSFSVEIALLRSDHFLVLGGGLGPIWSGVRDSLDLAAVRDEFVRMLEETRRSLDSGAQLSTPDPEIDRFFRESRIWFLKARRILPFGPPHAPDGTLNEEIPVITASPDYHGVFANDCVQSSYEGMLVAPQYRSVYESGCEVLLRYMSHCDDYIPEAVEFFQSDNRVFTQPLKIGQHPEWIASIASLVLLTGDKALGNRYWPEIERVFEFFRDANGDGINEWDVSAYPEQPDTTGYRNGMLYAQAWWVWAYRLAAETAEFLGLGERASSLRVTGQNAADAMERVFGREDGYASWLSSDGTVHPHKGHCMLIPVALGLSSRDRAKIVLETVQKSDIWMEPYGPRRADTNHPMGGGDTVWAFMRWNFIAGLFRAGQADHGVDIAGRWARAELSAGLPAPESFPEPITGITGNGYVWTAARAIRALTYGLFGIELRADGFTCDPALPAGWPHMTLTNLMFRDRSVTIQVLRDAPHGVSLNGKPVDTRYVRAEDLESASINTFVIRVP